MTESKLIQLLKPLLTSIGFRGIHRTIPGVLTTPHGSKVRIFPKGEPDLHAVKIMGREEITITAGMVITQKEKIAIACKIEVKTKRYKTVSPEQIENLNASEAMGQLCYIARHVGDNIVLYKWNQGDEQEVNRWGR